MVDPHDFELDVDAYRFGDHGWLAELDALAVHAGEPHQRMGTRAIGEAEWLLPDAHRPGELALRRRLVDEAGGEVFAALPGSEAACAETAELVRRWLADHLGHEPGEAREAGEPAVPAGGHPLEQAGLAVQEDLCVMQRDEEGWRFTAAVLCFPTYWRLGDKLGQVQERIHQPVPHYEGDLAVKVTRFFDRLAPGRIVARRNWGFSAHPLLFVPDLAAMRPRPEFHPDRLWLRSERQTLRRLEGSDAIVFTIRVQLAPATALAGHPDVARRLLDAMEGWSPELVASRGGRHGWVDQTKAWLRTLDHGSGG